MAPTANGGSSTSQSSLVYSSEYESQTTVRPEDQYNSHGSHHTNNIVTLRRAHSLKPAPPTRRSSSVISNEKVPNPGSNLTTPHSSMENLPPPPPHLLHSDDDNPSPPPPPSDNLIVSRVRSVAESVKALQKSGHLPCSPKSLRRAHSMMAAGAAKITPPPINEQIYAPVAHLQQKIQQRQLQQFQQTQGNNSQFAEQYGFGLQFQQSQSHFYHQTVNPEMEKTSLHPQQKQVHHPNGN